MQKISDINSSLLVMILIIISGNTAVSYSGEKYIYIIVFIVFLIYFFLKNKKIEKKHIYLIAVFVSLSFFHLLQFGYEVIFASVNFIIKLSIALLIVYLVPAFANHYIKTIKYLAIISLIFYIPVQLGVDLPNMLKAFNFVPIGELVHIGIHNFHIPREYGRNSGMFWEPGAFAGYLIIAILFAFSKSAQIKRNDIYILLIALITTFSTTGYIALSVVSLIYIMKIPQISYKFKILLSPTLMLLFLIFATYFYSSQEFLSEKINHQWEQTTYQTSNYEKTRMGNLLYDLDFISEKPLFGWSPVNSLRGQEAEELTTSQGNGLSAFAVRYGITGLAIFLFFSYLSFKKMYQDRKLAIGATFIIMIILSGEQFLNYPLIMVLLFLGITKKVSTPFAGKIRYAS